MKNLEKGGFAGTLSDGRKLSVIKYKDKDEVLVTVARPTLPPDTDLAIVKREGYHGVEAGACSVIVQKGMTHTSIRLTLETALAIGEMAKAVALRDKPTPEKEYVYWHSGDTKPKNMPTGCEYQHGFNDWRTEFAIPNDWGCYTRRWPKSVKKAKAKPAKRIRYSYWRYGEKAPDSCPEGCEYKSMRGTWKKETDHPSAWLGLTRRWPKPLKKVKPVKVKYVYWHPGAKKPTTFPAGCEWKCGDGSWESESWIPERWSGITRRWPKQ